LVRQKRVFGQDRSLFIFRESSTILVLRLTLTQLDAEAIQSGLSTKRLKPCLRIAD
jgi:hypothetical protein